MPDSTCSRCGGSVPPILSNSPGRATTWWRNQVQMIRQQPRWTLRFQRFRLRWLPADPGDQVRAIHTTLDLCDGCACAVFEFAQGRGSDRG